jgi:predicted nuclease with RNAse H fold
MEISANFIAIDFGAKLAGTTAICFEKNSVLHLLQSTKKQDADAWLRNIIAAQKPTAVFRGFGSDYHYRACDRAVGAMSPMFLGGLTARAMQLRAAFAGVPFYEIYPAHFVRLLLPGDAFYKKDLPLFVEKLAAMLPYPFAQQPENWHQVDAVLAWLTGWRHQKGTTIAFGEKAEGVIFV